MRRRQEAGLESDVVEVDGKVGVEGGDEVITAPRAIEGGEALEKRDSWESRGGGAVLDRNSWSCEGDGGDEVPGVFESGVLKPEIRSAPAMKLGGDDIASCPVTVSLEPGRRSAEDSKPVSWIRQQCSNTRMKCVTSNIRTRALDALPHRNQ